MTLEERRARVMQRREQEVRHAAEILDRQTRASIRAHQGERERARSLGGDCRAHRRGDSEQDACGEGRDEGFEVALDPIVSRWYRSFARSHSERGGVLV